MLSSHGGFLTNAVHQHKCHLKHRGWNTLIFSYIRRLGPFFCLFFVVVFFLGGGGVQNFEFQYFWRFSVK